MTRLLDTFGRGRLIWVVLLLAALAVPPADAGSSWVHRQGRYFAYWVPNRDWQAAESVSGIDISSPTGLATVSFGYATNGPAPYGLTGVRALLLSPQAGLSSVRLLSQGRAFSTGGGGTGQVTNFVAIRSRDRIAVRGILTAEVFNSAYGSYGFAAYLQLAPASQWSRWSPTLASIQKHALVLGAG